MRAPKKPDESFKVGDCVTVSLSAGRVVDGIVKAVINRTDGVRLQVDYGRATRRPRVSAAGAPV